MTLRMNTSEAQDAQLPCLPAEETLAKLAPFANKHTQTGEAENHRSNTPILIVLDDDPTGTQTCYDINVLMVWDQQTLVDEFSSGSSGFFILTNSRALTRLEARRLIAQICENVKEAASLTGKSFEMILRGDSTLRGHFPDEPEVAEQVLGPVDAWIFAPFFEDGGRLTLDDVHYVRSKDLLVPVAQTPFAKDATFGYQSSNLRDYVREKSQGSISDDRIVSISLEDIRSGGPARVCDRLMCVPKKAVIIVNAAVTVDMDVFVQGLQQACGRGMRFIYRTGAQFVSSRLGMIRKPPIQPEALGMDTSVTALGGLIVAGSYVPKTTAQLNALTQARGDKLKIISLDVQELLDGPSSISKVVMEASETAGEFIVAGRDVLVMTSRELITGSDGDSSLQIGQKVAEALVLFLRLLVPRPRYIIAKGGITSSDAATKGLKMTRAQICGQAAPGVPLWQCHDAFSKYAGVPYVVFPGNVGEDGTLAKLVEDWSIQKSISPPPMQYQRLGTSGLKVSRVILGCMSFGNPKWEGSPWILPEEEALPLLKKAYDVGINTWETADTYSNGQSEVIIGKALREYSIPRSKVVIITKIYYPVHENTNTRVQPAKNDGAEVNQMGLSRKHIFDAVHASLRRLGTDYIDVVQLHRLDRETDPKEVMKALHDLVSAGKIHYIGASSMHCWEFARLQYVAKLHDYTTFACMSGLYNLLYREEEREMIPFCNAEGIGLLPWSPVARGLLTRPWNERSQRSVQDVKTAKWFSGDQNEQIVNRVARLAERKGCSMSDIALAWLLTKGTCPILGLNSVERIEQVSRAFAVVLTTADITCLEGLYRPVEVQAI